MDNNLTKKSAIQGATSIPIHRIRTLWSPLEVMDGWTDPETDAFAAKTLPGSNRRRVNKTDLQ